MIEDPRITQMERYGELKDPWSSYQGGREIHIDLPDHDAKMRAFNEQMAAKSRAEAKEKQYAENKASA